MKRLLERTFATHPLGLLAGLCMISLTIPASVWLWKSSKNVGAVERAITEQGNLTRTSITNWLDAQMVPVLSHASLTADNTTVLAAGLLDKHLTALENKTQTEVRHGIDEGVAAIREFIKVADNRIGDTLARADSGLDEIHALREDIHPILINAASITAHANESVAILFRRDALPAQVLGVLGATKVTMGEFAQTGKVIRDSLPTFVKHGDFIATEFGSIASNINRLTKPHWYDRLLGYGLNGAVLARSIHPATNLTIKGVEFISSQK